MKYCLFFIAAVILSSCNLSKFAANITPEYIQAMAERDIDALFQGDIEPFKVLQADRSDADFTKLMTELMAEKSGGAKLQRDLVGANVSSHTNFTSGSGDGKTNIYALTYEIETAEGFTVVSLEYVKTPQDTECCRLNFINVSNTETAVHMDMNNAVFTITKILAVALPLLLVSIMFGLFWFERRKRAKL